jgi:endonuclease/exonuclease/phosphatase family metal-dependent hydrolase
MRFSALSWNVERFNATPQRSKRVADHIRKRQPDVFAILEVTEKDAIRNMVRDRFAAYDFGFTDSKRTLDILVGFKRGKFDQAFYTQRREFRAGSLDMRPGALATVRLGNTMHHVLFLHTDRGTGKADYANRQAMFRKIWSLKKALDGIDGSKTRLIVMGDLNTMGRRKAAGVSGVTAEKEIAQLDADAAAAGLVMLPKTADDTWRGSASSTRASNLDHVLATKNLDFRVLGQTSSGGSAKVIVDGWNQLTNSPAKLKDFIENISDHSALFVEVV